MPMDKRIEHHKITRPRARDFMVLNSFVNLRLILRCGCLRNCLSHRFFIHTGIV